MSPERSEQRTLDTDHEEPAIQVTEIVAELEDSEPEELTPIWDCINGSLENIFSDPPASHAELQISFNYEDYRITVAQRGMAWFGKKE